MPERLQLRLLVPLMALVLALCDAAKRFAARANADSGDRLVGTSGTLFLRQTVPLAVLMCIAAVLCFAQRDPSRMPPMGYELYSWQGPNGDWNFALLPSPSGVSLPAKAVFDKKFLLRGVKELNQGFSKLPAGATIDWVFQILGSSGKTKDTNRLSYPPANIIEQVQRNAETFHVEVHILK